MQFRDRLITPKQSPNLRLLVVFLSLLALWLVAASSGSAAASYSSQLRRYPYLTDVVGPYATINWGTDRSQTSGAVRFGKVGSESCTTHYISATKTAITVNGALEYQWKAMLNLMPGAQYCYRVYLGSSPVNEIDLLGSDSAPTFWTQLPSGATNSFSFVVFGDWGQVDSAGNNSSQANLMSLMASSGARFAMTTGDNGYPSGSQANFGDLIQTGSNISAIFGPSFWKVPGASMPIFPTMGNHGLNSSDTNHPALLTWPQDRAVSTSNGRYTKETYCCLNGTSSASYATAWYAFDAGPARFYVLNTAWSDSNVGTATDYKNDYDYHWAPGTAQYQWLVADLAAHPSVLKFAFFHYPLLSDNPNEATDTYLLGNTSLEGLLKQNGVDIAFTGHSHIYERNLPSAAGIFNYITGGGGATIGTLGTCTPLDAYAIKFTTTGKACGSAPVPTSAAQVYHFLKVTVNGTSVTVTPINSLGQSFDVRNYIFSADAESTAPTTPGNLNASASSGTQINLSWSASSDNTGVRGYGIYRDGVLVNTVDKNTLSYSDTNLAPSTNYAYRVDAFDGSGNHSALSTSKSATTQSTASYTFDSVADAYVAADFPSTNYGLSGTIRAVSSPEYRSYLRFVVNDINGTVTNATLRLYSTSSSATGYQIKRVTDQSWEEGTITYANAPAVGTLIGSSGNFSSGNWTSVNVTSLVNGNGIYDLVLTTTSSSNMNFNSRDASSNRPQLIIQTTAGVPPTATPTTIATSTPTSALTSMPTFTATATATANSGNTFTFTTVADARVVESSPTTNYGTATTLQADGGSGASQTSYIRFNASGINGSIQNVKLRVFCTTNGTANGPAVYLADSSWIESGTGGVTWNTQPTLLSGAVDNQGAFGTSTWVEYNVTSLVTGNGTYTFALVADSTDGVTFSSREGTTPPQLVITTQSTLTGTPTSTSTVTLTSTPSPTVTGTATPTHTPTATATSTSTLTPTQTSTPTYTSTAVATFTSTSTFTSTPTATRTMTSTNTSTATLTSTSTPTASNTPTSTVTPTSVVTNTPTPSATASPSFTPTIGLTLTPTRTPSPPSTATQTSTHTPTPINTFTSTLPPTVAITNSPTDIPTSTATVNSGSSFTFTTVADARVAQANPTTNYGTSTNIQADGDAGIMQNSYIRFNVSGVTGSIQSVKLRVFCTTNGTNNGPAAYLADSNWIESGTGGVTWNTQPALLSGAFDNKGAIATNSWVEYNVSSLVSGNGMYTFALVADSNDGVTFSSREGTTPPQLLITTQSGLPVTSTFTATVTLTRTPTVTSTSTPTATRTMTPTGTSTATVTSTNIPTASNTPTSTGTPTLVVTNTPTATNTATATPAPTSTHTPTNTPSRTPTATEATNTATATGTFTSTPTATVPTNTSTATPTLTPTPTSTTTVSPTPTNIPVPPTNPPTSTNTPTHTPTATKTSTPTATETLTGTSTATSTPTTTETSTTTITPTSTLTDLPSHTPTVTVRPTSTPTDTPTATSTDLPTDTPTLTETPTLPAPCLLTDTPTATATIMATNSDVPTQTSTAAPTQTGSFTFLPVADSYVSASCPGTNYGAATTLQVNSSPIVRSYLGFTVQGLNGTVTRAILRIFTDSASSSGVIASSVTNNIWAESAINYNNAPPIGSSLDSSGSFSVGEWISIDITAYITGNGTYNLALSTADSTVVSLASRESGANAPQLIIEMSP